MAKYEVTYACGHTETIQLYGKSAERQKEIARLENRLCKKCYIAEQREAAKEVVNSVKDFGLATLTGSPKQVAWAESIRAKFFAGYGEQLNKEAEKTEKVAEFRDFLVGQEEATYWIDTRSFSTRERVAHWKEETGN